MFHNFRALFFLFSLFCSTSCILAYPKYYRIVHDMETIESQFSKIINEIKKLPNEEPITIFIDGGYFNISKTINLKDVKHDIIIIGSKKSPTIISGSIKVEGWEQQTDGLWKSRKLTTDSLNSILALHKNLLLMELWLDMLSDQELHSTHKIYL